MKVGDKAKPPSDLQKQLEIARKVKAKEDKAARDQAKLSKKQAEEQAVSDRINKEKEEAAAKAKKAEEEERRKV